MCSADSVDFQFMSLISYLQRGFNSIASLRIFSITSPQVESIQSSHTPAPLNPANAENCLTFEYNQQMSGDLAFDKLVTEKDVTFNSNMLQTTVDRLKSVFTDCPEGAGSISSMMALSKTVYDMSVWSFDSQKERDSQTKIFVSIAKEVCTKIRSLGYWSNFIDPTSGMPFEGCYSNEPLTDCDEDFPGLTNDLQLEDIGCCRALKHAQWGFNVFAGLIVCTAPQEIALDAYNSSLQYASVK